MATYNVSTLMQDIRIALDENDASTPLITEGNIDAITLNDIIHSKIEDAAAVVCKQAPLSMTDGGTTAFAATQSNKLSEGLGGNITVPDGEFILPADYLRLVYIKMSTWKRPVVEPITPVDPLYAQMASEVTGVTGNVNRPVAAIVNKPDGLNMELYPSTGNLSGCYLARPAITSAQSTETIALPPKLKPAIVQYTAALTCMALGMADKAKIYIEYVKSLLQ